MTQTQQAYELFSIERQDMVATVTINNPPMNLIGETFCVELNAVIDELEADTDVRAVLFRSGIDGVFVAGADVSLFADATEDSLKGLHELLAVFDRLASLRQPSVAAIGGMALGGGFEFCLACDFRIMAEGFGEVGLPEVRLGVLPGGGGTQRLPRLVGQAVATEMLIKGMRYKPDEALQRNLLHRVVPADQLDAEATKFAQGLARQAPLAVQSIKRLIRASFETPGEAGLKLERELFVDLLRSSDAREGVSAFFEGRKAEFSGE